MRLTVVTVTAALVSVGVAIAASMPKINNVKPGEYDPAHTMLVQAAWLSGIGCPTASDQDLNGDNHPDAGTYTDPACGTGDTKDNKNMGLLLAKTGPTPNNAAAQ